MLEVISNPVDSRAILAVGGDHWNPEWRPRRCCIRKSTKIKNKSAWEVRDYKDDVSSESIKTLSKLNIFEDTFDTIENNKFLKTQDKPIKRTHGLKSVSRLRLKSANIYKPKRMEIRKSVLDGEMSTYANSHLETKLKSEDLLSSINIQTVSL